MCCAELAGGVREVAMGSKEPNGRMSVSKAMYGTSLLG